MEVEWRRAAAYVVCRDDRQRILLTRFVHESHPDSGRWTMPGGGMEWGEHPAETAARELEEETGLTATIGAVVGVFSRWYAADEAVSGEAGHMIGIVHETGDVTGELRSEVDGTTDAVAWFTLDEARELPRVDLVDFVLSLVADPDADTGSDAQAPG
ncbi:MAG: NUDIX domain-containing protein [Actinomycetota bacterium]|nr:NUDIX domain-containing protein [Actinomycetota bacterium]